MDENVGGRGPTKLLFTFDAATGSGADLHQDWISSSREITQSKGTATMTEFQNPIGSTQSRALLAGWVITGELGIRVSSPSEKQARSCPGSRNGSAKPMKSPSPRP